MSTAIVVTLFMRSLHPLLRPPYAVGKKEASIIISVASGWSGCRVGLAPTGKRRLFTPHTPCGHTDFPKPDVGYHVPRAQGQYRVSNFLGERESATTRLQGLHHIATLDGDECLIRSPNETFLVANSLGLAGSHLGGLRPSSCCYISDEAHGAGPTECRSPARRYRRGRTVAPRLARQAPDSVRLPGKPAVLTPCSQPVSDSAVPSPTTRPAEHGVRDAR